MSQTPCERPVSCPRLRAADRAAGPRARRGAPRCRRLGALPRAPWPACCRGGGGPPAPGCVTLRLAGRRGPCRSLGCWGGRRGHGGHGLGGARGSALPAGGRRAGGGRQPAAGTRSPRPLPPSAAGSGGAGTRTPRTLLPPAARLSASHFDVSLSGCYSIMLPPDLMVNN